MIIVNRNARGPDRQRRRLSMSRAQRAEIERRLDAGENLHAIAAATGVSWARVYGVMYRRSGPLGVNPGPAIAAGLLASGWSAWTPEVDALLGTRTDKEIARQIGRSHQAVQQRRARKGIAAFRSRAREGRVMDTGRTLPWAPPQRPHRSDDTIPHPGPNVHLVGALVLWFAPGGRIVIAHVEWKPNRKHMSWREFNARHIVTQRRYDRRRAARVRAARSSDQ